MGGLWRFGGQLPWHLHARLELRTGNPAPLPRPGAHAARDRIRAIARRTWPPSVPHRATYSRAGARLPCRGGWAARRHYEGLPRLANLRRPRVAARTVAEGAAEPGLLHRYMGPGP